MFSGSETKGFVGSELGIEPVVLEKHRRRGRGWQPRKINDSATEESSGQRLKGV